MNISYKIQDVNMPELARMLVYRSSKAGNSVSKNKQIQIYKYTSRKTHNTLYYISSFVLVVILKLADGFDLFYQ